MPAGRLLGVFGARPPELGGYDANPVSDAVGRRLQEIIAAKARMHPDLHVVSGLRLGAEMLGAEAAIAEGVPLVVVLPFPDADKPWPEASRRRVRPAPLGRRRPRCCSSARCRTRRPRSPGSLRRRDAWLGKNLDEAIVVWDGQEPFVGRLLETLRERLGEDVWEEPVPVAGR